MCNAKYIHVPNLYIRAEMNMSEEMNSLLKQMMEQMNKLQEQVNTLQSKQSTTAAATGMETDDVEHEEGGLVEVSEATQAFLGAAFSGTMDNEDRRKRIRRIGVPDCDQIRCPKLDGVMKAVLPTDTRKGGRFYPGGTMLDGKRSSADGPRKVQKTAA